MTFKEAYENYRKAGNDLIGVMLDEAIDFKNTTPFRQHMLISAIAMITETGNVITKDFKEDIK
jgi:hypothetical protein